MLGGSQGTVGYGVVLTAYNNYSRNFNNFRRELSMTSAASTSFQNKLSGLAAKSAMLGGAAFAGISMLKGLKGTLDISAEYEQIEVAIQSISGGVDKGNELIQKLKEFTLKSPLGFQDTVKNAKMLLAYGIPLADIMENMEMLTGISAGVGLDKFNALSFAYGQIYSAKQLYGQEAYQLVNAGVGIYGEIAEVKNMEVAKLKALLKSGKMIITEQEVKEALMRMVGEGGKFNGLLEKQMQSFSGQTSILRDQLYFINIGFGEALRERYKAPLSWLVAMVGKLAAMAGTSHGKGLMNRIVGTIEVFTILSTVGALLMLAKTFGMLTGFLLPSYIRLSFMTAVASNNMGRAFLIASRSFLVGFGAVLGTIGTLIGVVVILDGAFQRLFGEDYAGMFQNSLLGLFNLIDNYNPHTGQSLMNADTIAQVNKTEGSGELAVNMFYYYRAIRTVVRSIGEGMLFVYGIMSKIMTGGFFNKANPMEHIVGTIDFDKLQRIGRVVGAIFGTIFMYRTAKAIANFLRIGKIIGLLGRLMRWFGNTAAGKWLFAPLYRYAAKMKQVWLYGIVPMFKDVFGTALKGVINFGKGIYKFMVKNLGRAVNKIKQMNAYIKITTALSRIMNFVLNAGVTQFLKKITLLVLVPLLIIYGVTRLIKLLKSTDWNALIKFTPPEWWQKMWGTHKDTRKGWEHDAQNDTPPERPFRPKSIPFSEQPKLPEYDASGTTHYPLDPNMTINLRINGRQLYTILEEYQNKKEEVKK